MGREDHNFLQFFISPSESKDEMPETFNLGGILATIIGVSCLVYVVLMCVCKDSGQQRKTKDVEGQQSSDKTDKKSGVAENGAESRSRTSVADQAAGGRTSSAFDATAGHQTNSMPTNAPASMGRLLPVPPVSSDETHVTQPAGSQRPSSGVKHGGHISGVAPQNNQQFLRKNLVSSGASGKEMSKSDSNDYEHLGPKCLTTPSDYDILGELKSQESNTNTAPAEDSESSDDDYSELDDNTYPEVIDVNAKRKELPAPHSKVKVETELKEEDPYNHIGDSDGTVSTKIIQQLKQSSHNHAGDSGGSVSAALVDELKQQRELDDPYATVQDSSAGEFRHVLKAGDITQDMNSNNATGTTHHVVIGEPLTKGKRDIRENYAVIHKTKEEGKLKVRNQQQSSADELSPYSVSPPEPPRLYTVLDVDENVAAVDTFTHKKHKYSKVTARESLASISARRSENPYESMTDTYENTYMLVDGSAVNEMDIICEADDFEANGVNEISDLYAEIGISGESIKYNISSNSENNKNIATSTTKPSLLNPVNLANGQQVSNNNNQFSHNYTLSAGADGYISNHHQDTREYEDMYATLNEKSYMPSTSADGSQAIPRLSNNQTSQSQASGSRTVQQVNDSEDYEEMGELVEKIVHEKIGLVGNRDVAFGEHKKVKQRRKGLNHKQQRT